jgi:hypothetical protein
MTHMLIASDRIEGTPIYSRSGEKIGTIERLMLDKITGTACYAVIKHSGFLGTDLHHYPVPWNALKYNLQRKSYEIDLTFEELRSGPSDLDGDAFDWGDRSPAVYLHPQYWGV